ncbi:MAG: Fic family protein [Parcubacteria group bacterium]|nr:Fic family protein [Parcubacteria group bacterium]
MPKLTERQLNILEFIKQHNGASNKAIKDYLKNASRITVNRDLRRLLLEKLIKKEGQGRGIRYFEASSGEPFRYFDAQEYFKKGPDERTVKYESFNFNIFKNLKEVFIKSELNELNILNDDYKKRIKNLPPAIIKKEFERLTIDLSWKSSRIEGNTYSLLDTEILIKEHREAEGHEKEEAIMILNHKKALDYIRNKKSDFKKITWRKIENIQRLIVEDLKVQTGLRKKPVGIIGTRYRPLDNEHQIKEAVEKTAVKINSFKDPFSKASAAILLVSYLQPFEDGNKRTARLLGDALLSAYNACPLSFRSINEADYKKAIILFYEQNSLRFFKELFIEQFKFAVRNYFLG